jgi:transcription-repair coupling factor (superfamily II helicase)
MKLIKRKVDVLTLTATPIPRTYICADWRKGYEHYTNSATRSLPIETVVSKFDESLIRNAILKEINRGGQVYFS